MEWEASKVAGVRKGNVIAFGARDPSGIERDRERVVVAFEMAEAEDVTRAHAVAQEVRKAVQEGMGLTVDDVVPVVPGALPKTSSGKLQRAKTRELYEAGELLGRAGKGEGSKVDLVKSAAPEPAELPEARGPRRPTRHEAERLTVVGRRSSGAGQG